jgi:DNA primase
VDEGRLAAVVEAAAQFFRAQAGGSWVPGYLAGRGFTADTQARWGVGFAPDAWTALTGHLRRQGFGDGELELAGVSKRSARGTLIDTFRDRAMLPVRLADGTVAGFTGRARPGTGRRAPPYLNGPNTPLYRKGEVLFGLHEARTAFASGACPVIAEGPLDAIAVSASGAGRYAGVAPCGTALTAAQVRLLAQTPGALAAGALAAGALAAGAHTHTAGTLAHPAGVIVAFDGDAPGRRAAVRAFGLLRDSDSDGAQQARWVPFTVGDDPAGVLEQRGPGALNDLLTGAVPLADLVIDERVARFERWLEFPDGTFGALRDVAPVIASLPADQVARQVGRVASRLGLAHSEVTRAVIDAVH